MQEAYDEMQPMIERFMRDGGFYEWYTRDNKPNGSPSFKGSAGVLAKAVDMLQIWAEQHK